LNGLEGSNGVPTLGSSGLDIGVYCHAWVVLECDDLTDWR
jgi:hypothetical protein